MLSPAEIVRTELESKSGNAVDVLETMARKIDALQTSLARHRKLYSDARRDREALLAMLSSSAERHHADLKHHDPFEICHDEACSAVREGMSTLSNNIKNRSAG